MIDETYLRLIQYSLKPGGRVFASTAYPISSLFYCDGDVTSSNTMVLRRDVLDILAYCDVPSN